MYFFKPYSYKYRFQNKVESINFTKYKSVRRYRLNHLFALTSFIWFYWFLNFAFRIGTIPNFISCNFHGYMIAKQSPGICIPVTQNHESIKGSARHLINISVNKYGKIVINGDHLNLDEVGEVLLKNRYYDPNGIPFLIIDRDCKMEIVNKMLYEIRQSHFFKVYFFTNEYGSKM